MVFHHILCDEWSIYLIARELSSRYHEIIEGSFPKLSNMKIQHKDCSAWIRTKRWDGQVPAMRSYWLSQLGEVLPVLNLPTIKPRPSIKQYAADGVSFQIDRKLMDTLKKVSRQNQTTVFVTILTFIKALLFRYTGQTDIVIGTPVSIRENDDLRNQLGFYLNTLALRTNIQRKRHLFGAFGKSKNNDKGGFFQSILSI